MSDWVVSLLLWVNLVLTAHAATVTYVRAEDGGAAPPEDRQSADPASGFGSVQLAQLQQGAEKSRQWRIYVQSGGAKSGRWRHWNGGRPCLNCRNINQDWARFLEAHDAMRREGPVAEPQGEEEITEQELMEHMASPVPLFATPRTRHPNQYEGLCFGAMNLTEHMIEQVSALETAHQFANVSNVGIFWKSALAGAANMADNPFTAFLGFVSDKVIGEVQKDLIDIGFGRGSPVANAMRWGGGVSALSALRSSNDFMTALGRFGGTAEGTRRALIEQRNYARKWMKVYMGEELRDERHYKDHLRTQLDALAGQIAQQQAVCARAEASGER